LASGRRRRGYVNRDRPGVSLNENGVDTGVTIGIVVPRSGDQGVVAVRSEDSIVSYLAPSTSPQPPPDRPLPQPSGYVSLSPLRDGPERGADEILDAVEGVGAMTGRDAGQQLRSTPGGNIGAEEITASRPSPPM
jgi:hypothetical protein